MHRKYLFGGSATLLLPLLLLPVSLTGQLRADDLSAQEFASQVRPLLEQYCSECHAGDVTEADIDLGAFATLGNVQQQSQVWLKVRAILASGEMPPKDSPQPSDTERRVLQSWVRSFLAREAEASAGDPGPIVLRRLNNEEYNYTVRDLTGVESLNPTREFPVDGAAGEGFINTGSAQSISPAFITKYLDAANEVAAHVVLLPDGIRFSPFTTRRDQTDELLARIQSFYARFTEEGNGSAVDLQGIKFDTNQGGVLPLEKYLLATLEQRTVLSQSDKSIEAVATERSLNARYLRTLWQMLNAPQVGQSESPSYLAELRQRWQQATPQDAAKLVAAIEATQQQLWKFNTIGQLTAGGKQKIWMEPVSAIVTEQELRLPLAADSAEPDLVVYLNASDLGDGRDADFVVWQRPRFEFRPNQAGVAHSPILLADVPRLVPRIQQLLATELPRTKLYLAAAVALRDAHSQADQMARNQGLNVALLNQWIELVGIGSGASREIRGGFTNKIANAGGHAAINGWGFDQTPNMLTNQSNEDISFSSLTVPARGVVMHPSPTLESVATWRSPLDGKVTLSGLVADADASCGNGAAWRVELQSAVGITILVEGVFDNGGKGQFQPPAEIQVQRGDVVSLIVNSRDQSHACDTTHVAFTLTEVGRDLAGELESGNRKWDLASDTVDRIGDSNPLPDSYGNADTWQFGATEPSTENLAALAVDSSLAFWRAAVMAGHPAEEISNLAEAVQNVLCSQADAALAEADRTLRAELLDWRGPLDWISVAGQPTGLAADSDNPGESPNMPVGQREIDKPKTDQAIALDALAEMFGKHPDGSSIGGTSIDGASLCLQAPQGLELRLPAALVAGSEFVVSVTLHAETSRDGSVQVHVSDAKPTTPQSWAGNLTPALPVLISRDSTAMPRVQSAMDEFRELFPPALCYARIVPVDEVVTMTLFFREDVHLQRLMLSEAEIAELDRLWDELLYVAQEPLALMVVFEQIYQFATQDRPDLVNEFEPMREPINERGERFRQRLIETQPAQVEAVIEFADRAWRRALPAAEAEDLRDFYTQLRTADLGHDESIRLMIVRVLASPAFLYRREQPAAGNEPAVVTDSEMATRLSYFLWSSLPDAELRQLALSEQLTREDVLLGQVQRMLAAPQTRRLAIQFACQWLHLRDFDKNDDKNEQLYPEFATLRHDMYEETVLFFEDMFRSDGSVLELIDADHTFVNESLAKHYGIEVQAGTQWRRVEGIGEHGRGGVLGMATLLASQSGASRTSPILRGNWVYETLLGQRLPRPPANVPVLPEELPAGLTARQLIEQHSSAPGCATCHVKIDHFGFALEQYDAIGRVRPLAVDTKTQAENGTQIEGLAGLKDYLLSQRRDEIVRQFCRKLLGFALGREVQLSDEPLLDIMEQRLTDNDYRFSVAVETIVTSDQFRKIRARDE